MKNGICLIAAAALRMHADHKSEMVSQILFGETFCILEATTSWYHVELFHDHYRGWVARNQVKTLSDESFELLENSTKQYAGDMLAGMREIKTGAHFPVSGGSTLYPGEKGIVKISDREFSYEGEVLTPETVCSRDIAKLATKFLHTPYLWGGRSAFGLDCSGFVQLVYKITGISLPRDAYVQANQGKPVHLIHEALPGDLVFFDDAEEVIDHVGILIDEAHVIHAHGTVRIDKIDHHGIFNTDTSTYSHPLRLIKRVT